VMFPLLKTRSRLRVTNFLLKAMLLTPPTGALLTSVRSRMTPMSSYRRGHQGAIARVPLDLCGVTTP
jgi:hypothetical protein